MRTKCTPSKRDDGVWASAFSLPQGSRTRRLRLQSEALESNLVEWIRYSNRLANILRQPTEIELAAHRGLLTQNLLRVENFEHFVHHVADGAGWRASNTAARAEDEPHIEDLKAALQVVIEGAQSELAPPEGVESIFRMLRPFTDGNGRSARALLMWRAVRGLGFCPRLREGGRGN